LGESGDAVFCYETPVHSGTGTSSSVVDFPIRWERITGLSKIQASSLKGMLRAETEVLLRRKFPKQSISQKYRFATMEALALPQWLKRFAEAKLSKGKKSDGANGNRLGTP